MVSTSVAGLVEQAAPVALEREQERERERERVTKRERERVKWASGACLYAFLFVYSTVVNTL